MSSDMQQQITPFDGYGQEAAEFSGPAGAGGLSTTALVRQSGGQSSALSAYDPSIGGGQQQAQVFKKIHQSLRGRYFFAITLGLILGAAGGFIGYKSQKPLFRGESLVQIRMEQKITSGNQISPFFEELMQSETLTISSRGMIKAAMKSNDWAATGLAGDSEAQNDVVEHLAAEHPARTEYIRLYFTDPDPQVAATVVTAVTNAYKKFFQDRATGDEANRLNLLQKRVEKLFLEIQTIDARILDISKEWSTHNLDAIYEKKAEEATELERVVQKAEIALEQAKAREGAADAVLNWSVERIANFYPVLAAKIADRDRVKIDMDMMEAAGVMKGNPKMQQYAKLVEIRNNEIDRIVADWRDLQKMGMDDPALATGPIGKLLAMTPKVMEKEVASLKARKQKAEDEMKAVGLKNVELKDLVKQRDEKMKDKNDNERNLERMAMDARIGTRLNVVYNGEVSSKPFKDRRKMVGAAGAMFGFGLPIGVFVLMGLLDRRYRYTDDAGESV